MGVAIEMAATVAAICKLLSVLMAYIGVALIFAGVLVAGTLVVNRLMKPRKEPQSHD